MQSPAAQTTSRAAPSRGVAGAQRGFTGWVAIALAATLLAIGAPSAAVAGDRDPEAARQFARANRLYTAGRYDEALQAFRRAHDIDPAPSLAFNMGRCHEQLGQHVEALTRYRAFVAAAPPSRSRDEAQQRIVALTAIVSRTRVELSLESTPPGALVVLDDRESLGPTPTTRWVPFGEHTLTLTLPEHVLWSRVVVLEAGPRRTIAAQLVKVSAPGRLVLVGAPIGAVVAVDGSTVPNDGPLELAPGEHRVHVRAEGYEPFQATVDIRPGGARELKVQLATLPPPVVEKIATPPEGLSDMEIGGVAVGAVGLGALAAGGVLLILSYDTAAEAREYTGTEPHTKARWDELVDRGEEQLLGARIAAGVGAGLLAAGAAFYLLGPDGAAADGAVSVQVSVNPGPGVVWAEAAWAF